MVRVFEVLMLVGSPKNDLINDRRRNLKTKKIKEKQNPKVEIH